MLGVFADPCGIDAGADGFYDAGGLVAILCREGGSFEILAVAKHDLGAIEAKSFDAEANLSMARCGEGEFIELKDFGAACFVEADEFYGIGHAGSWDFIYCFPLDGLGGA